MIADVNSIHVAIAAIAGAISTFFLVIYSSWIPQSRSKILNAFALKLFTTAL